ncbi:cysteinyl leukotriene receptor 2 isoform X2 [Panthera tigris]|uniref:cysteinyl leukotriene receptor 2 isoform X2 n=1 Tax=Panthera tigris TaxID=9694 RepID=UPI001C6FB228|nr:cysteinyl leukotriene receptor 2 isoform X2 [Panthera tigris]
MEAEVWKAEGVKGLTCFPSFYLWQSLQGYMLKTAKLKNVCSCVPHLAGNHQVTSTLDFRSTGVDEKHLARKPGCQNPRSKGTQPRHQERGSSSAVFWPALKFFKFANQGTASCTCPAKGLHNEEDYISDFLILCETRHGATHRTNQGWKQEAQLRSNVSNPGKREIVSLDLSCSRRVMRSGLTPDIF